MNVFEKLKNGEPIDMMSEEYLPAIAELQRADRALFHLNHVEPQSEEQKKAFEELFDGSMPEGIGIFTPTQIDFPKQITFGRNVFINHSFTAMSIGGIEMLLQQSAAAHRMRLRKQAHSSLGNMQASSQAPICSLTAA